MAILAPDRVRSLVFEGGHQLAHTHESKGLAVMKRVREKPTILPAEMQAALAAGHGDDYWQQLLWMWTEAWRLLYEQGGDVYKGRLGEISCPVLVMHGARDPHTTLDEMEDLAAQIPNAETLFFSNGGHSVHDDPALLDAIHAAVLRLFAQAQVWS